METSNRSSGTDFILLGFSSQPQLQHFISVVVVIFYVVTLVGDRTIILVSYLDTQLHTPMYFFLSNFSFVDLCYTTSIIPQMLVNLWGSKKSITYGGCALQFFSALDLGATECLPLAVMAYDRYAAVCQPLHHTVIMLGGLGSALILCSLTLKLPRCGHREVEKRLLIEVVLFGVITQAVMRIKANTTFQEEGQFFTLFYTIITPSFNPLIYTLGNRDVKNAVKRTLGMDKHSAQA
uniref:Olfactory receptor family 2 subfamily AD member 1 n=1 Tax=Nannospalax galili TaxID=1026970 RepID=A0A8C6W8V9_NANGA